jgi:glyoxylase-like metal-dependent hydrolase (beta-lactamase superfamily II)
MLFAGPALAQPPARSQVQTKTTDLGNKTYMLEGAGGASPSRSAPTASSWWTPSSRTCPTGSRRRSRRSPLPIKYIINTHFHGDHTGGNASFQKDGAVVLAQDNIRVRLLAGTQNGTTGNKTPPLSGDAIPKETYIGGRRPSRSAAARRCLRHVYNAHTDGDTYVYFPDANVICTGDIMNSNHRYQQVDFANGGDIRGMIRATEEWLKLANDQTKVVVGHGALANKAKVAEYNAMVKAARERIEKLYREGKSEAEVVAADPLKDLNATWAANPEGAVNYTKQVYNSFKRS